MRRSAATILSALVVAAVAAGGSAAAASAPDPPPGFKFCGWHEFAGGGWTYDEPEGGGAFTRLYARDMKCRIARRNFKKVDYGSEPPYRPRLAGYRCREIESRHAYSDVKCAKKQRRGVAFRWQTGP